MFCTSAKKFSWSPNSWACRFPVTTCIFFMHQRCLESSTMPPVSACSVALFGKKWENMSYPDLSCQATICKNTNSLPRFYSLTLMCHRDQPKNECWLQLINQNKPLEKRLNGVCMSPTIPTFDWRWSPLSSNCTFLSSCCLIIFVNWFFFFVFNFWNWCNAYRSLSLYVDYPVGCYVYSTLTVQSLLNQNQSCLLYSS